MGAVALILAAIAAAVYGPHAVHGGFLSDSWSIRAVYVFAPHDGFGGAVDALLANLNQAARPLNAVYLAALNGAFGSHMGFWFAWLGATSVLMSLSLYLLLRKIDFGFLDAGLIAALVLAFPATSSLRFWAGTAQITVAVSLAAFGFLLALIAFDTLGARRRVALHGASLAAFVASLLLYEAAMPLMLASALLYRVRVPWSRAVRRWGVDVVVLASVAAVVASSSSGVKEVQGAGGMWHHAVTIFDQSWTLLATVVLPLGSGSWYLLALVGLVPLAAALTARRLPREDPARAQLRRWLWVLAGGLVVVALAYTVFVPGIDFYTPLGPGDLNRVNAVPSVGWVLVLYALITLSATLAFRGLPRSRTMTSALVALACVLVAVGWLRTVSRDSDFYVAAFREDERVLATIRSALPDPPPNSTIWTFGQPLEVALGIPVFGNTWDMTYSVQLMYGDPTINSYVGSPETTFECRPDAVVPGGNDNYPPAPEPQVGKFASSYGNTYFIDTTSGRLEPIRTPAQCLRASRSFERSPPLPGVPAPPVSPASQRLGTASGSPGTGQRRIVVAPRTVTGYVESLRVEGVNVTVTGWAASSDLEHAATDVRTLAARRVVADATPSAERPDVVDAYGKPALRQSGFELYFPVSSLNCSAARGGLTVLGSFGGVGNRLEWLGGAEQRLDEACRGGRTRR